MQSINPYDSGGRGERHSANVVDDFMGIEEEIKAQKDGALEGTAESEAEGTEDDLDNETTEEKIKNLETEIITKIAAVIKDVRAKTDTKLTAETENIRAEFDAKIEQLISKIGERERGCK